MPPFSTALKWARKFSSKQHWPLDVFIGFWNCLERYLFLLMLIFLFWWQCVNIRVVIFSGKKNFDKTMEVHFVSTSLFLSPVSPVLLKKTAINWELRKKLNANIRDLIGSLNLPWYLFNWYFWTMFRVFLNKASIADYFLLLSSSSPFSIPFKEKSRTWFRTQVVYFQYFRICS